MVVGMVVLLVRGVVGKLMVLVMVVMLGGWWCGVAGEGVVWFW